jgi:tetratricopeptide (TPR) repeat protein
MVPGQNHLSRAIGCIGRGDTRGAIEALRWALTYDPLAARLHALLALCLVDAKRIHAAEHEAQAALELEPELHNAHLAMAHVRFAQGKLDRAEQLLVDADRLDPGEVSVMRLRARILAARGKRREAVRLLEDARACDPEDVDTRLSLGEAYLQANRPGDAAEIAHDVLREHAESHRGLVLQGWVELYRGNGRDAREHALMALRQNASSPAALRLLAGVNARRNVFLGLWWRVNLQLSVLSSSARIMVLIGGYVVYRVGTTMASAGGYPGVADGVSWLWIGVVIYSWIGPAIFMRMVARELTQVRLRPGF